uniref:Uncharacterized protein n=1 Tax=Colobus angolensis palliatus TaxID=336983 RepID=A0A2K5IQQ0_COLAP
MTQTLYTREDPLNLGGGGWAHSASLSSWSSCHRRPQGAPVYNRPHRYSPKTEYGPPRKQPKQQHGPGFWFQPPVCFNWGCWGGPWRPPPPGFRKFHCPVQVFRVYGLHPLCFCCCSCWNGSWNPSWVRPPGRKKRWGRRGRGLRHHPRRSSPRGPPRRVKLYEWREPGMRAPPNTTQFIMNQIYEDMRQQEKLKRQQEALRAQKAPVSGEASPARSSGNDAPPGGSEETWGLQEALYGFVQNPSLAFSPKPEENQSLAPLLVEEEEKKNDDEEEYDQEVCDAKEEEEVEDEEEEEVEDEEEEEVEEAEYVEEEEEEEEEDEKLEGEEEVLEENQQRGEEFHLPLEMPLSIFVEAEEKRENFIKQIIPKVSQESLFTAQDFNC